LIPIGRSSGLRRTIVCARTERSLSKIAHFGCVLPIAVTSTFNEPYLTAATWDRLAAR
jgi:porphobilinogen deaminase